MKRFILVQLFNSNIIKTKKNLKIYLKSLYGLNLFQFKVKLNVFECFDDCGYYWIMDIKDNDMDLSL